MVLKRRKAVSRKLKRIFHLRVRYTDFFENDNLKYYAYVGFLAVIRTKKTKKKNQEQRKQQPHQTVNNKKKYQPQHSQQQSQHKQQQEQLQ